MPEPAPPGELCSGKLGEFSQAFRADSIFGSQERGMTITRARQWQHQPDLKDGGWVGLFNPAFSQAKAAGVGLA